MKPPKDDVDQLMAIMGVAFDPAYGEAWTRRQIEDALLIGNCRYRLLGAAGTGFQPDEDAAGFFLSRPGFAEEELLLLAVDPVRRRQGLGLSLLNELATGAISRGAKRLLLEMRRGNPAESLYRRFGFQPIGMRPNYYRTTAGETIDAITFAHDL